jgi:hypothetical protein
MLLLGVQFILRDREGGKIVYYILQMISDSTAVSVLLEAYACTFLFSSTR